MILWIGFLALCILSLHNIQEHPSPFNQIDEHGHLSYALHLITHQRWWPDFSDFRMFDVPTGTELTTLNYINHPPTFYWLAKLMDILFPWWQPVHLRAMALTFYLLAMLLYTRIGTSLHLTPSASMLYALMPLLLYMHLQIGFYNNDALCMLGGMVATSASLLWFRGHHPTQAWRWMWFGVLFASMKLTALLLVGTYVLACLMLRRTQLRSLTFGGWLYGIAVAILCIAPYLYMTIAFGSPAPNTAGQLAKLAECLHCTTQGLAPEASFIQWLPFFLSKFADQLSAAETTFLPIALYVLSLATLCVRLSLNTAADPSNPMAAMATASAAATCFMLIVHTIFSWQRYRDYGWIFDGLLRYYLPLIGAYAAVSAHALAQLSSQKRAGHDQTHR